LGIEYVHTGFRAQDSLYVVNKKRIDAKAKTERMTGMKSLSFKIGMILLSIGLFVVMKCLEQRETKWINHYEHIPAYCNADQQGIVYASKYTARGWIESTYREGFNIDTGAKLGYSKRFSKSGNIPTMILIGIAIWGAAIIFILGLVLYRIVVEPIVEKRKLRRSERR